MSSKKRTCASTSNLPLPVLPVFTNDQLALIFGTCLADAAFVLDCETGKLVATNESFLRRLELDLEAVADSDQPFTSLVHPADRGLFSTWLREDFLEVDNCFQARLLTTTGRALSVEISLKCIRWQSREYRLGFLRDCEERVQREETLKQRVQLEKSRAMLALKNSLRVYGLNEKIKSTLDLTAKLLNVENEEQLFSEAEKVLTNADGLNYRDATFLVLHGTELRLVAASRSQRADIYSLAEDNKYSRWVRRSGGGTETEERPGEILVPLRSRDSLLGLIEVSQHQREKAFFDECELVSGWQRDTLFQLGDIIALILDNLRLKRELKRQSITDPLTNAYNRNFFMSRLAAEVHRAARYRRAVSLVFIDVDHFKAINDRYGHLQGDKVLYELGTLLRSNLREADILCRYGGDEFVILLPETNERSALDTSEKLIRTARQHSFYHLDNPEQPIHVTISAGITTLQQGQSEEQFLQQADSALYEAKRGGRNRAQSSARSVPEPA